MIQALAKLRALRLQKLEAGGRVEEQVLDGQDGAGRRANAGPLDQAAAFEPQPRAHRLVPRARDQRHTANGGDARQGLAPKAKRADVEQVLGLAHLARGVTLERRLDLGGGDADAVVGHADQPLAALTDLDADIRRLSIQGVLDQFLDHGDRAFDDLTRRDFCGDILRQYDNRHTSSSAG